MDRLNEIVKALTKQLADKNDTKKALKLLERQLKNLYDLFMTKGHNHAHEHEDDAMFTKKPLGGTSCASCEKDIVNLYGKKADYIAWGKFPFRDPAERIARVCLLILVICYIGRARVLQDAVHDQPWHHFQVRP